jgi:FKBP-type peptidyl-prolyl cis-trans isomerase
MDYKKTPGGMPYKIFTNENGEFIRNGKFFKLHFTQKINDSVYFSTEGKMPLYFPVTATIKSYDISELWGIARKGDSIVSIQIMDTFIRKFPEMAEKFKKDDRIISHIKILDVFDSDSLQQLDAADERKNLLSSEIAFIENYLREKKIKAQKTPSGAFVEIFQPGSGNFIDSGNYVSVKYRGQTFSGTIFDTNMDTTFGHTELLSFMIGSGEMIRGFEESLLSLKKGAVARFYIPSLLAFGSQPNSDNIKPYDNIIFDIEVIEVSEKTPLPANAQMQQQNKTDNKTQPNRSQ